MKTKLALASTLLTLIGLDQTAKASHDFVVRDIAYAGSACPAGSVGYAIYDGGFGLSLDGLVAELGRGISVSESRKNCQINVDVDVPHGYTYGVVAAGLEAYADLSSGVNATAKLSAYFQGQRQTSTLQDTVYGPYQGDVFFSDVNDMRNVVWKPCGADRSLNLNVQLRLSGSRSRSGFVAASDASSFFLAVKTKRCQ